MPVYNAKERVLALDIRSSRCGFAVFEGPHALIDFGARGYARKCGPVRTIARRQFAKLLDMHCPSVIVFRSAFTGSHITRARMKLLTSTLRQVARSQSVRTRFLSRKKVKSLFEAQALFTKYAVASHLAEKHCELVWLVPAKVRKSWESERPQMAVFDAVAAAMVHFQCPDIGRE